MSAPRQKRRLWTPEDVAVMIEGYVSLGSGAMAAKLGRTEASVRLKAQGLGIVRPDYRIGFRDCNDDAIQPGDLVTLVGQKTRATVIQLVRRGIHRGTVLVDPPLKFSHHDPSDLERVDRRLPERKSPMAARPGLRETPFNQWLRAAGRSRAVE